MDVPTTAEVGMPDVLAENWYGMVAPGATPPAIVAALNRIATEAMRDPAVKEKLASQGAELIGDTPEHFRGFIEAEIREMGEGDQGRRRRNRRSSECRYMRAALRRCSTSSFAGRGSVLKLRAQIASLRLAQASRILIIAIGIDRAQRLRGGFRHHRNADAGRHHLADRVEIPQPRPEPQAHAEPRGMLCDVDLQRGRTGQPDEVAVGHLLKIDLAAAGKLAAPRRHQHQPVLAEQEPLDMCPAARARRQSRDRRRRSRSPPRYRCFRAPRHRR